MVTSATYFRILLSYLGCQFFVALLCFAEECSSLCYVNALDGCSDVHIIFNMELIILSFLWIDNHYILPCLEYFAENWSLVL